MLKRILFTFGILVAQTQISFAQTDVCDDLWFARNIIMDEAGFCFGTNLGQAVFDNSDCSTKEPNLSAIDKKRIEEIRASEQSLSCNVDTTKSELEIHLLGIRRSLKIQPLNDGTESTCIGYNCEERIPLYVDTDPTSEVVGHILTGDDVGYGHVPYTNTKDGWFFVSSVGKEGKTVPIMGWTNSVVINECDDFAG